MNTSDEASRSDTPAGEEARTAGEERLARQRAEAELVRVRRALDVLTATRQVLRLPLDEAGALDAVCRIIVERGDYSAAWIGFAEQDENTLIRPAGLAGAERSVFDNVRISWADSEGDGVPSVTAIRTSQPFVVNDIGRDDADTAWQRAAASQGYASAASVPLIDEGRTIGALSVYATVPNAFDKIELTWLASVADELARDVGLLRTREAWRRAQQALEIKDFALQSAVNAIAFADMDGRVTYANPAFVTMWRFAAAPDVVGRSILEFMDDPKRVAGVVDTVMTTGHWDGELVGRRMDGTTVPLWASTSKVTGPDGLPICLFGTFVDVTARRQADEALRQTQKSLETAQEIARLGSWELDVHSGRGHWSKEMFRLFGRNPADGPPPFDEFMSLVAPEDREPLLDAETRAIETGQPVTVEYRTASAQAGDVRHFEAMIYAIRDADGRAPRTGGTVLDITERKRAEARLLESERHFRRLLQSAPLPLAVSTPDGRIVEVNERFVRVFGYTAEDIPSIAVWFPLAYPDETYRAWAYQRWSRATRQAAETGSDIEPAEYLITCKNGERRTMEVSGVDVGDALLVTFIDLTERKQAEAKLRDSEQHFRRLIHSAPLPLAVVTLDGRTRDVNERFVRVFGYTVADVPTVADWFPLAFPDEAERTRAMATWYATIDHALKTGTDIETREYVIACRNGDRRTMAVSGVNIGDLLLVTFVDLTDRQRAEEALRVRDEIYASIIDQAMDSVALVDGSTGTFIEFNEAAHRDLGYTREAFASMTIAGIQAEHSDDEIRRNIEEIRTSGRAIFETRHRHRNGELRNVLVRSRQLTLRDRGYIAAVWTDITERKRMEHDLRERLKELTCLSQVQQLLDRPSKARDVGASIASLLAPAMQFPDAAVAIVELDGVRRASGDEGAARPAHLAADIVVRGRQRGQVAVRYTDDSPFILPHEQNLLDGIASSLGLWLDRQEAEAGLEKALLYTRSLIETSVDSMVSIGPDGRLTDVNVATEMLTGVGRDTLIGTDFADYFTEPDKARDTYQAVFSQGTVRDSPLTARHVSGRTTEVLYNASVYWGATGEVQGVLAVARDVTELKRAEAERAEQMAELRRWHEATLGREGRVLEIKREVNALLARLGEPPRYLSALDEDAEPNPTGGPR